MIQLMKKIIKKDPYIFKTSYKLYNYILGEDSSKTKKTKKTKKKTKNDLTFISNERLKDFEFSTTKKNIIYVPWLKNSLSLIETLEERTDLNFIPFNCYKDINNPNYRRQLLRKSRMNKKRIQNEIIKKLEDNILNIDALLVTLDWTDALKNIVVACKKVGIPTFLVPHESVFANQNLFYKCTVTGNNIPVTDYILCWGDLQFNLFKERGVLEKKMVKVGSPKFDTYKNYEPSLMKQEFYKQNSLDSEKKTILFATQPLDSQYDENRALNSQSDLAEDLLNICETNNWQLILRLPPSRGKEIIREETLEKLEKASFAAIEGEIYKEAKPSDAIYHSDFVISINSTMLFEAFLLNKPSISAAYAEFEIFWDKAGIPVVYNKKELEKILKKYMNKLKHSVSEKGLEWSKKNLSDGEFTLESSKKIEKTIKNILKNKNKETNKTELNKMIMENKLIHLNNQVFKLSLKNISDQFKLLYEIEKLEINSKNELCIVGWSFIEGFNCKALEDVEIKLKFEELNNNKQFNFTVNIKSREDITFVYGEEEQNYDYSGFHASIPLNEINTIEGEIFGLVLEVTNGGFKKIKRLEVPKN